MSGMKPLILRRAATGSPSRKREQSYESNIFVTVEITKTGLQDRPTYRLHLGISIQNNGSVWEIGLETAISAKVFFAEPQANESIDPEIRDVASPPGIPFDHPLFTRSGSSSLREFGVLGKVNNRATASRSKAIAAAYSAIGRSKSRLNSKRTLLSPRQLSPPPK